LTLRVSRVGGAGDEGRATRRRRSRVSVPESQCVHIVKHRSLWTCSGKSQPVRAETTALLAGYRQGRLADAEATGAPWRARRAVDADVADGAVAEFFPEALQELRSHEADLSCPCGGVSGDGELA